MSLVVDFSTITEMFDAITAKYSQGTKYVLQYKTNGVYKGITYAELKTDVELFSLGLYALGVHRGDRIALIAENRPEWVVTDMGMLGIGAVNVPLYTSLTPEQIKYIFLDAEIKYVVVSNRLQLNKILKIQGETPLLRKIILMNEDGAEMNDIIHSFSEILEMGKRADVSQKRFLEQEKRRTRHEDILTLIYTSGTTGNPKGVILTHENMVSNIKASAPCIPITPDDTLLSYLPLCHSFERMAGYYTAMSCGATTAYAESIDTVRENILEVRPTIVTSVPRLFEKIYNRLQRQISGHTPFRQKIFYWAVETGKKYATLKRAGTVSPVLAMKRLIAHRLVYQKIQARTGGRIKFFVSGGAALSKELAEFFEAIGILILEGYGLSEASPVITVNRLENYKFGSVGLPIAGTEVKIASDGEILARGPNIMQGYWNNKKETDESIDTDGWLHTGDIGMFDEDGFLHITDRKKHLLVSSGGKNIAPQPIENGFLQSAYIDQVVLIGDKRMFCTALIVPDFEMLKDYARGKGINSSTTNELIQHEQVVKLYEGEINTHQQHSALYERVRKFTLLPQPLTIENGEITPSLKIRRKFVEEKYREVIEKMYEGRT